MKRIFAFAFLSAAVVMVGCKKQSETLSLAPLSDYYPLKTGQSILYRLDSTVTAKTVSSNTGALVVKSYLAKDSVESTFTDNEGRTSYRIFRFIRDTAATQPWTFAATYVATPANNGIEYVDNNLRYIKLKMPVQEGYTFKGNSYIDTKSSNSILKYLDEWDYAYENVGQPYTIKGKTFDNTVTVFQHDETSPAGAFDPNLEFQVRALGKEVYAKGIGLVYKEFLYWNWQKNPKQGFDDNSFGVKLTYISN